MTKKEIINAAIHNYLHDDTEKEMAVKDWLHDVVEKSEVFDKVLKSHDTAPSYSEIGDDVIGIVDEYRGNS